MRLIQQTSTDAANLLLPAASGHCRIDPTTSAEDATIRALLTAAVAFVEGETGQQLFTARYALHLDGFPASRQVTLPKPPFQEVDAITYVSASGTENTLPQADYIPDPAGSRPGRVTFKSEPPPVKDAPANVVIEFTAGYGDTADKVPALLTQAVLMTFGHWYEHREAAIDRRIDEVPLAVQSIIAQHVHPEVV